jgi:hypothetical protein
MSARFRVAAAVASMSAGVVVLALACGPGPIGDLTAGRAATNPADAGNKCPNRAVWPDPPPDSGADLGTVPDVLLAVDQMRVDTGDFDAGLPKPLSYDLDHTCPCVEKPSCVPIDASIACPSNPDGRDNVSGPLLGDLSALVPGIQPSYLIKRIHEGIYTILFLIQQWNGTPNDPHVVVMARMSPGLNRRSDSGVFVPNFDGNDVWDVDENSIVEGDQLVNQDCNAVACIGQVDLTAYVTNGVLVARFDSIPLTLSTANGPLTLPFANAVVTGELSKDGSIYRLKNGQMAGRLPVTKLLAAATALQDPVTLRSLCPSDPSYALFKGSVCAAADLASDSAKDGTNAPCDALSEAVALTALSARVGVVRGVVQQQGDCPAVVDSCSR